jgi:hypothetical protein
MAVLWASLLVTMIWTADAWWLRLLLVIIGVGVTLHVVRLPSFQPGMAFDEAPPSTPTT